MKVREVSGSSKALERYIPTVWKADATTVCILLDNEASERWLLITLDLSEQAQSPIQLHQLEAA